MKIIAVFLTAWMLAAPVQNSVSKKPDPAKLVTQTNLPMLKKAGSLYLKHVGENQLIYHWLRGKLSVPEKMRIEIKGRISVADNSSTIIDDDGIILAYVWLNNAKGTQPIMVGYATKNAPHPVLLSGMHGLDPDDFNFILVQVSKQVKKDPVIFLGFTTESAKEFRWVLISEHLLEIGIMQPYIAISSNVFEHPLVSNGKFGISDSTSKDFTSGKTGLKIPLDKELTAKLHEGNKECNVVCISQ